MMDLFAFTAGAIVLMLIVIVVAHWIILPFTVDRHLSNAVSAMRNANSRLDNIEELVKGIVKELKKGK